MRQHTEQLEDVLRGSFERDLTVNVFNGPNRILEGIRFESWSLDSDLSQVVCSGGQGVAVIPSINGESYSPVGTEGVLSAFRARVELVLTVRAGDFTEQVSLGMFRVMQIPSAQDFTTVFDGRTVVQASRVGVKFDSLDSDIDRWGFAFPEQSNAGVSAFGEIRRFTGMAVEQTVPDVELPSTKVWEPKQGGRLEAVIELGKVLGGSAVVNSRGAWEIVPDTVGEPVTTLYLGEMGTVVDDPETEVDTDTVYNEVIGSFEDVNGAPIYAVARVNSGPLSVEGPYGTNTRYYASDLVTTQEQADGAVQSVLDQSISSQKVGIRIQCHVNPIVEIGDVVELVGWNRPLIGRVQKVSLNNGPLMNVVLEVSRWLT